MVASLPLEILPGIDPVVAFRSENKERCCRMLSGVHTMREAMEKVVLSYRLGGCRPASGLVFVFAAKGVCTSLEKPGRGRVFLVAQQCLRSEYRSGISRPPRPFSATRFYRPWVYMAETLSK